MRNVRNGVIGLLGVAAVGLVGALSTDADGNTYSKSYEWDVVRTTDVPDNGAGNKAFSLLPLARCTSGTNVTCPAKGTTVAVSPTFPKITCYVGDDGWIYAKFLSAADDMPTSWPSAVSCSYNIGGHTFTANIDLNPQSTEGWDKSDTHAWVPSDGVVFDFDPIVSGASGVNVWAFRSHPLPPTPDYVSEVVEGVKGGSAWSGVLCEIVESGTGAPSDWLIVHIDETASAGSGGCPIQRTGQSTVSVAITVDRP